MHTAMTEVRKESQERNRRSEFPRYGAERLLGEHEVLFAGEDEVIEFKHTAYSKAVFAKGALEAAKFLAGKPAGKYDMSDVISF